MTDRVLSYEQKLFLVSQQAWAALQSMSAACDTAWSMDMDAHHDKLCKVRESLAQHWTSMVDGLAAIRAARLVQEKDQHDDKLSSGSSQALPSRGKLPAEDLDNDGA